MQTLVTMLFPQLNDKSLTIAGTGTKFPLRYKFARAAGVRLLMRISALELNIALTEYIQTFPSESRLNGYLAEKYSAQYKAEIHSFLSAAVKTTEEFLWAHPGGVNWSSEFEKELFNHIVSRHPWLELSGFSSLLSFSKWLCWHEGLNA